MAQIINKANVNPGIHFRARWIDDAIGKLEIEASDGKSLFRNEVYVDHQSLSDLVEGLSTFKHHMYGGIYDITFGSFRPEYAGGAFDARLHFQPRGKILVTVRGQSEFEEFGVKTVASEATLYLWTEPALLDNFIGELEALKSGERDQVRLEAV